MNSFHCPFCDVEMPITESTHNIQYPAFNNNCGKILRMDGSIHYYDSTIGIEFFKCPKCNNYSVFAIGLGTSMQKLLSSSPLIPNSLAKQFPKYIPKAIREDYEEAYSIVNLSPKASATLARRCLQGMIRDFWGISKSRLIDEINALQTKVSITQWQAIDAIRSIGNIGAHMEKDINVIVDVDPDEAQKLLKLIELLIDKWYITRHEEQELLNNVTQIANTKKSQKQSSSN